jgi:Xaa-Pro aminopeptidase
MKLNLKAAIVRYLAWLHDQLINKNKKVNEFEGALKLLEFRKENELFMDLSFDTISSSSENSAIIHYKPEINNCKDIDPNQIYLLDSGGQYLYL